MLKNLDGRIDCIIFCHGVLNFMSDISHSTFEEFDTVQRINVRSTMHFLSICIPFLRMTAGSVSVLSSSAGEHPWPGHSVYNTAMACLNMMVRCSALENSNFGVRINAVAPGVVRSESARCNPDFSGGLNPDQNL
jgi:meso-butanediol dehydrogenase/(S,S)-butanediol dehydrogenase/diacetyl reductase